MSLPIYAYFIKAALDDKTSGISSDALDMPEGFDLSLLDCSKRSGGDEHRPPPNIPGLGE
jgi:hypothetical protein